MRVSVIIPTFERTEKILETLAHISTCNPVPDEVLVHIEFGDPHSGPVIASEFPHVRQFTSNVRLGPGGGRNRLMREVKNEIVVSLDDDSYPLDADFFPAAAAAIERHPEAGVIAMNIIHDDEPVIERKRAARPVADFVGCGCIYRRSAFRDTSGYVPVQPAYGVEEADLALQLLDAGWTIVHDDDLRVRHATSRSHQASAAITAAHISNVALLAYLRYPLRYWPLGLAHVANRIFWSLRNHRHAGIGAGIAAIPGKIWRFRALRRPVTPGTMRKVKRLRRGTSQFAANGT
jgi:GT2 family glycosyltransferase